MLQGYIGVTAVDDAHHVIVEAHPLLPAERDARAQMLAALRALNLDVEPLHDRPCRPAGR